MYGINLNIIIAIIETGFKYSLFKVFSLCSYILYILFIKKGFTGIIGRDRVLIHM